MSTPTQDQIDRLREELDYWSRTDDGHSRGVVSGIRTALIILDLDLEVQQ